MRVLRPGVHSAVQLQGVPVLEDQDQYATDLMKCVAEIAEREQTLGVKVSWHSAL